MENEKKIEDSEQLEFEKLNWNPEVSFKYIKYLWE